MRNLDVVTHSKDSRASQSLMRIGLVFATLVGWTVVTVQAGLWGTYWQLLIFINFLAIIYLASSIGEFIVLKHKRKYEVAIAILFPILVLVFWEWLVAQGILSARWFPPPSAIAVALRDLTVEYDRFNEVSLLGRFWMIPEAYAESGWEGVQAHIDESHVYATLMRVFAGFTFGMIPGLVVGIVMGLSKTVRTMLDPTISALYVLPKIAIFPLVMLMFRDDPFGEGPKIAVVAISTFFLVAINTMVGVRDTDPVLLMAARNFGANRWQSFVHVVWPAALPVIFAGMRIALGTALIVVVAIEFIRAKKGVGWVTFYHWEILSTEKMYAGLVVVMILGITLTLILQFIEVYLMPWKRHQR